MSAKRTLSRKAPAKKRTKARTVKGLRFLKQPILVLGYGRDRVFPDLEAARAWMKTINPCTVTVVDIKAAKYRTVHVKGGQKRCGRGMPKRKA